MDVLVHPSLDKEYFTERAQEVADRLEGEESITFTVLFMHDTEGCKEMADKIGISEEELRQACKKGHSSSIRVDEREYIVVSVDEAFIREDEAAARGLIAHEIMHTVQRYTGLEEDIEEAGIDNVDRVVNGLMDRGFSSEEATAFLKKIVSTAILALKDIYSNTVLVKQGFSSDLETYYYRMLGIDEFCPMPEFYQQENHLPDVIDAIEFELQLLPAWLPFEGLDREKADRIRERIKECYEVNLPDTAQYINRISDLYHKDFADSHEFRRRFFEEIITSSFAILDTKIRTDGKAVQSGDR